MMKRCMLFIALLSGTLAANAQKFAFIDTEYIMNAIPAYQDASKQLDSSSKTWQAAVEASANQAKTLYDAYQSKAASMTDAQRTAQENAIVAKEKEAADLRQKYFGPEGELAKLQEQLIMPIQDDIYEAVKQIAEAKNYAAIIDRATAQSVIFADPRVDISDEVLQALGYSK